MLCRASDMNRVASLLVGLVVLQPLAARSFEQPVSLGLPPLVAQAPGRPLDLGSTEAPVAPALRPPEARPGAPLQFKSIRDAFQIGIRNYNAGDTENAVEALSYAAEQGHSAARWKLGRMYAAGDGVPADPIKAFDYFSKLVGAETMPDATTAPFVANAHVALGRYFLVGIPNTAVKANPGLARRHFATAANLFDDSDAQYSLARLFMDGVGGPKDRVQAARWLLVAAEKCHRPAQAVLGHMLFAGEGVPKQAARGLMWLQIAREGGGEAWITQLHKEAFAAAKDNDRQAAQVFRRDVGCGKN